MFHSAGVVWLRLAVVYLVIGVGLGIAMGMSGNHTQFPTHAHLNLLGWVSLALIGLTYRQFPDRRRTGNHHQPRPNRTRRIHPPACSHSGRT